MTGSRLFAISALAGIAVAAFFMIRSVNDDLVYYLTTSEAVENRADFLDGRAFKISGLVVPGTIVELGEGQSEFQITDGAATVDVRLTRVPPPLFDDDVPVLLSGAWDGEEFVADEALIRHDEDYETPASGNYERDPAAAAETG
jgi:cytochrome c-type biogenesis protein CcmE